MTVDLPEKKTLSISKAAKFLGVSPETLRRWDRAGILKPYRTRGNQRRYSLARLKAFKVGEKPSKPGLSISQAAEYLGVHPETLRRWEREGAIEPKRTNGNQRRYTKAELDRVKVTPKLPPSAAGAAPSPRCSVPDIRSYSPIRRGLAVAAALAIAALVWSAVPPLGRERIARFFAPGPPDPIVDVNDGFQYRVGGGQVFSIRPKFPLEAGQVVTDMLRVLKDAALNTTRLLGTLFFGQGTEYFITPAGEASLRSVSVEDGLTAGSVSSTVLSAGQITASRLAIDSLVVSSPEVVENLNADLLDGQDGSYYLDLDNEAGTCDDCLGSTEVGGLGVGDITPDIVSSVDGVINDGGDIDFIAGNNISITPDDFTNTITFAVTGGGIGNADTLDTLDSAQFLRSDASDSFTSGTLSFSAGTALDLSAATLILANGQIDESRVAGEIESVVAGQGLSGGGASGAVTLNVGAGTNIAVNANDIATVMNPSFTTSVTSPLYTGAGAVSLSSGGGLGLTLDSASGSVIIATDDDLIPTLGAGDADIGAVGARWDNVYAVGGDFSGTLAAATIQGNLAWGYITSQPNIVSSVDGVTNDEGDIDLIAGDNISITPDNPNNRITISVSGGGGSGLDADTFDTLDSSQFLRSDVSDNYTSGTLTFDNLTGLTMAAGSVLDVSLGTLTLADNQVGWAKVSKTGSSLADLATRSAGDLDSGTLSTDRYSAYADLTAEGYLDLNADGDLVTRAQGDARYLSFSTIVTSSGTNPVADLYNDTLNLVAGSNITVTGDSATDTITIAATGLDNYQFWTAQDGDTTTYTITSLDTLQFAEGAGVDVDFTGDDILTIAHLTGDGYNHIPSGGSSAQILQYSSAGEAKWVTVSGDIAIADGGAAAIQADAVALGTDTTNDYVASITGGSGIDSTGATSGEGISHTLSLGPLTADWAQSGAFDIVLGNAGSELKILESAGGAFYGIFDVGDLSSDQTYTFGAGGTVVSSGNVSSYAVTGVSGTADRIISSNSGAGATTIDIASTYVGQTSITTLGTITTGTWTADDVALAHGGTNASLTAVSGGIVYSTASAMAISAAGTLGQVLTSGGAGAPVWVDQSSLSVGNADTLDSLDSTQFLRSDASDSFTSGTLTIGAAATSLTIDTLLDINEDVDIDLDAVDEELHLLSTLTNTTGSDYDLVKLSKTAVVDDDTTDTYAGSILNLTLTNTETLGIITDTTNIIELDGTANDGWTGNFFLSQVGASEKFKVDYQGSVTIAGDLTVQGTGSHAFSGHIIPSGDDQYDLGSTTARWRDLYLGPTSLNIYRTTGADAEYFTIGYDGTPTITFSSLADGSGTARDFNFSGGNVGIGAAAPSAKLQVAIDGLNKSISVENVGSPGTLPFVVTNGHAAYDPLTYPAVLSVGKTNENSALFTGRVAIGYNSPGTAALAINGNVGIGTTEPSQRLLVVGSYSGTNPLSSDRIGAFVNDGTTTTNSVFSIIAGNAGVSAIDLGDSNNQDAGGLYYYHSDNHLEFRTNDVTTARMVIDSSGRVGIGTTSPDEELTITFDQNSDTQVKISNSTAGDMAVSGYFMESDSADGGFGVFSSAYDGGAGAGHLLGHFADRVGFTAYVAASGLDILAMAPGADIRFYTNGDILSGQDKMRITSDGNVGIGTATVGDNKLYVYDSYGGTTPRRGLTIESTWAPTGDLGTIYPVAQFLNVKYNNDHARSGGFLSAFRNFVTSQGSDAIPVVIQDLYAKNEGSGTMDYVRAIWVRKFDNTGAGSITEVTGLQVNNQPDADSAYGAKLKIASGTDRWNIYAEGTAPNYFAGDVGIGITSPLSLLHVGAAGTPGSIDGTNDLYVYDDLEVGGTIYGDGTGITGITAAPGAVMVRSSTTTGA